MKHLIPFIIAAVLISVATSQAHAAEDGTLVGTVTDPTGAVFVGANVWIRWNNTSGLMGEGRKARTPSKREVHLRTDANGTFTVKLGPGAYDIFVYADAFEPTCGLAVITSGETRELKLHFPRHAGPSE